MAKGTTVALPTTTKVTKAPPTTKVMETMTADQPTSPRVTTPKAKVMDIIPTRMTEATTSLVKLPEQPLKMGISVVRLRAMTSFPITPSPSPNLMKKKRSTSAVPTRSPMSKL